MKTKSTIIVIILFSFLGFSKISNANFAGGQLTYKCLGGNEYLITFTFYRDCSCQAAPDSVLVEFECPSDTSLNYDKYLQKSFWTGNEVTPGCSALPTSCNGGTTWGVQEYVYQAYVTLPPCNSWKMSCTGDSRVSVYPVPNNLSNHWFTMATLNNQLAPSNSSSSFSSYNIIAAINYFLDCFNHGTVDMNGDSLSYSFFTPFTNNENSNVMYYLPYSSQNFIQSSSPISLDSVTGDLCYNPSSILNSIFGVKVTEYRKINNIYTEIGSVYRDLYIHIQKYDNHIPKLSGMDFQNTHHYNSNDTIHFYETIYQTNMAISFDINGFDEDNFDSTTLAHPERFMISWNNGIPQGNFQTFYQGTDSAYAHFQWLPQSIDASNAPRCFTATIKDQACPYYGSSTHSYCITIKPNPIGIDEFSNKNLLSISSFYPNPTKGKTFVDIELIKESQIKIEILDLLGNIVLEKDFGKLQGGKSNVEIPLDNLQAGLYFVTIKIGNEIYSKKLVIE